MKNFVLEIPITINTYDIDIAGHVNNIVYVKWIEELRIKLFEQIYPVEKMLEKNLYLVVISTNITYKKQLKFNEKLTGKIYIDSLKHGMINLKIEITSGNIVASYAEQKCVIMDMKEAKMDKSVYKEITDLFSKAN